MSAMEASLSRQVTGFGAKRQKRALFSKSHQHLSHAATLSMFSGLCWIVIISLRDRTCSTNPELASSSNLEAPRCIHHSLLLLCD